MDFKPTRSVSNQQDLDLLPMVNSAQVFNRETALKSASG